MTDDDLRTVMVRRLDRGMEYIEGQRCGEYDDPLVPKRAFKTALDAFASFLEQYGDGRSIPEIAKCLRDYLACR